MKTKLLSFFFFLSMTNVIAQDKSILSEPGGFATITEAAQMADQIVKAAGRKANFMIAEAQVPNALAVIYQGKRFILYNPGFINALTRATGTKWAAISVLAHEIGHHLYNKPAQQRTTALATELEADEFSGYVLEKMGATLEEAQAALKMLATSYATRTHPARDHRTNSVALGWKSAGGVEPDREVQGSVTNTPNRSTILPENNIAATIFFNANPDAAFYVTTKMNVVKIGNDQVAMIGRLTRSNNRDYPYIIYDDSGYRLYVNAYGNIFNTGGKMVGQMKAGTA